MDFCNKLLSNKVNLNLHMNKACKKRKIIFNDLQKLIDEIEILKKQNIIDISTKLKPRRSNKSIILQ